LSHRRLCAQSRFRTISRREQRTRSPVNCYLKSDGIDDSVSSPPRWPMSDSGGRSVGLDEPCRPERCAEAASFVQIGVPIIAALWHGGGMADEKRRITRRALLATTAAAGAAAAVGSCKYRSQLFLLRDAPRAEQQRPDWAESHV